MKVKQKFSPKWMISSLLAFFGITVGATLPGYQCSGLFLLELASLVPVYHGLNLLKSSHLTLWRWLHGGLTLGLCLMASVMILTGAVIVRSARGTPSPKSDYLIVLGAGVNGSVPSRSLRERLDAAHAFLQQHPDAVAVVSGGQGRHEDISEAQCMYSWLTEHGISGDRVWMEDKAANTVQNLRFSLDLIENRTGSRPQHAAIVSSEYHLHRAGMFARRLNLEAELVPAKTEVLPLRWNYYLREIFAVWYYSLFGGSHYA